MSLCLVDGELLQGRKVILNGTRNTLILLVFFLQALQKNQHLVFVVEESVEMGYHLEEIGKKKKFDCLKTASLKIIKISHICYPKDIIWAGTLR